MSQDYTVAKELASLKEIKQSAEQRISDLSLNALNYVNDHRLHKAGGEGGNSVSDIFHVHLLYDETSEYLDATYQEIEEAVNSGMLVVLQVVPGSYQFLSAIEHTDGESYTVYFATTVDSTSTEFINVIYKYISDSANGRLSISVRPEESSVTSFAYCLSLGLRSVLGQYIGGPEGNILHRVSFDIYGLDGGYHNYIEMTFYTYVDTDTETSDPIDLIQITTDNDDETVILLFDKLMGSVPDKMPDYGQNVYRCWVEFDTDGTPLYPNKSLIEYILANEAEVNFIL